MKIIVTTGADDTVSIESSGSISQKDYEIEKSIVEGKYNITSIDGPGGGMGCCVGVDLPIKIKIRSGFENDNTINVQKTISKEFLKELEYNEEIECDKFIEQELCLELARQILKDKKYKLKVRTDSMCVKYSISLRVDYGN